MFGDICKPPVPSPIRRHQDRPRRRSDGWFVLIGYVLLVVFVIGMTAHAYKLAKEQKRISMMETTINTLTTQYGDCNINRMNEEVLP